MSYWSDGYTTWAPRRTAAQRRAEAERTIRDAARRGKAKSPVGITGRKIAHTFWGKAWCDNLERYRDFAYRLERGRSYLRSGSVLDLQIAAGKIAAEVLGSRLYEVAIEIEAVTSAAWRALQRDCAGSIGSRLDLLSGRLSDAVMAQLCAERTGLFPAPSAIRFSCSCPDYAVMCKHVAAVMYGVGARLDGDPALLFTLRRVSLDELLASAVTELPAAPATGRILAAGGLASLFGIELVEGAATARAAPNKPDKRTAATPIRRSVKTKAASSAGAAAKRNRRPAPGGARSAGEVEQAARKRVGKPRAAGSKRSTPAAKAARAVRRSR